MNLRLFRMSFQTHENILNLQVKKNIDPGSKPSLAQYWPNIVKLGEHWNIGIEYLPNICPIYMSEYWLSNIGRTFFQ